jgi:DNA (cytosine-5)-methyltransferase 1
VEDSLRELHLFAGAGGGILGGILLGHTPVCAVEIEPYPRKVLLQRQRDGIFPKFPIWDDIRTFDGNPWRGLVDVVCGGFPCQDISAAGKGAGITGERSGLWAEMARIIREIQPQFAFVENSPILTSRGLGVVLGDLARMGYDARWGVLSCADVGGVHLRKRIWIKAANAEKLYSYGGKNNRKHGSTEISKPRDDFSASRSSHHWEEREQGKFQKKIYRFKRFPWGEDVRGIEDLRGRSDLPEPLIRRIGHDVAFGMDRLAVIGNGQVPRVVKLAWETLSEGLI